MTLNPLFEASLQIQIHAITAIIAFVLGPFAIYRRRRDRLHKVLGYIWVVLMLIAATSAIFINEIRLIGPFSPIHAFVVLTYVSLWQGIRAAISGQIEKHRKAMSQLYFFALVGAGLFTFLPGRTMSRMVFPEYPVVGFVVLCLVAISLFWRNRIRVF